MQQMSDYQQSQPDWNTCLIKVIAAILGTIALGILILGIAIGVIFSGAL